MSENLLKDEKETNVEELITPEKFINKETGEVNVQSLLKSYLYLEKKLSEKTANAPKLPNSAEEYNINYHEKYVDIDEDLNKKLFSSGFTQEQAQLVYDLAEEKLVPLVVDMASCFQADKERCRLEDKFGGSDKWTEVSRQLHEYGKNKLDENVLTGLSSSYDGIIALYNMMKEEAPSISVNEEIAGVVSQEDLYKMMQDKRYWQSKDKAFVDRVTNGFQKLYK